MLFLGGASSFVAPTKLTLWSTLTKNDGKIHHALIGKSTTYMANLNQLFSTFPSLIKIGHVGRWKPLSTIKWFSYVSCFLRLPESDSKSTSFFTQVLSPWSAILRRGRTRRQCVKFDGNGCFFKSLRSWCGIDLFCLSSWNYYSQLNGQIKNVPNHQPVMFVKEFGLKTSGEANI